MVKIFLFIVFVNLLSISSLAQYIKEVNKKSVTGIAGVQPKKNNTPNANTINSKERISQNSCYKGFEFTVKNYGYSKLGENYSWGIKVKNNYPKAVSLRYKLIVGNDNSSRGTLTYSIKPRETYHNDYGTAMALIVNSSSDQYRIEVSEVCFEGQDCIKNGYADCNGKQTFINSNTGSSENKNKGTNPQEEAFEVVQIESEFPGGGAAWGKFLQRNLNADVPSTNGAPPGRYTVMLSFIVNKDGAISEVSCVKDPGYGICQEAKRLLNQSPNWTPAVQNGRNVTSRKRQSITFLVSKE